MKLPEYFLSCDWGTTNFRLKLVNTNSLEIVKEVKSDQGVKVLYEKFLQQDERSQTDYFSDYLLTQIQLLPTEHQTHTIIAAGMATSNIGLYELDYAEIPFNGNGKSLISKQIELKDNLELVLISGVKNQHGMMRGEETQAIGLEDNLKTYGDGILILPGTHSKHITYKNGDFVELKNFMTGELFEIISQKSILSNSIKKSNKDQIIEEPFFEGLKLGNQGKLTSSLFSIRANDILRGAKKEDNYFFLSGLLIGDELSYLNELDTTVFLASPDPISNLYNLALEHIVGSERLVAFKSEVVEKAMLRGQQKIIMNHDQ